MEVISQNAGNTKNAWVTFDRTACCIRVYFPNECFAMSENFDERFY